MDLRDSAGAEALIIDHAAYDDVRRLSTFFVIGGLEIDRRGASNLLGIRRGDGWARRGAGAIGTTAMAAIAPRTVLYSRRHDPKTFVARCSVVSAAGHAPKDAAAAAGPVLCLSPAGVFDFPTPTRQMRLVHYREGWPPERVAAETGFDLDGLETATPLPAPEPDRLAVLRERVDVDGVLR
jgi:acyl CoA:acetate/3-ketoacid CoA transferase beta subunit